MNGKKKVFGISVVAALLVGLALVGGAFVFTQGSVQGDTTQDQVADQTNESPTTEKMNFDGPWAQENLRPKKIQEIEDLQGNAVSDGTIYVYDEKPTNSDGETIWCDTDNGNVRDHLDDKKDKVTFSSSEVTLQYQPEEYFLYVNSSGRYDECASIIIPDGSNTDRKFDDYQSSPSYAEDAVVMADKYSPSLSAFSFGVGNTTTTETWDDDQTITPDEYTQYRADYAMVYIGTVDPTTDSDDNGDYDEGIKKFVMEVSGAGSTSKTIFYSTDGIDELGSDNKARVDLSGMTATRDQGLTLMPKVTTFETKDSGHTAADGDEILTAGENPLDLKLFDASGDQTSKIDING
jgi:hypothetical protein